MFLKTPKQLLLVGGKSPEILVFGFLIFLLPIATFFCYRSDDDQSGYLHYRRGNRWLGDCVPV